MCSLVDTFEPSPNLTWILPSWAIMNVFNLNYFNRRLTKASGVFFFLGLAPRSPFCSVFWTRLPGELRSEAHSGSQSASRWLMTDSNASQSMKVCTASSETVYMRAYNYKSIQWRFYGLVDYINASKTSVLYLWVHKSTYKAIKHNLFKCIWPNINAYLKCTN